MPSSGVSPTTPEQAERLQQRLDKALRSWPEWAESPADHYEPLSGGKSNHCYLVRCQKQLFVLRLDGDMSGALGVDRERERQAWERATLAGLAPQALYRNPVDGLTISQYLVAQAWTQDHSHDITQLKKLGQLLKKIHQLPALNSHWELREHLCSYRQQLTATDTFATLLEPYHVLIDRQLDALDHNSQALCHLDLQAGNLLIDDNQNLIALDWEYAAMAPPLFDLAIVIETHELDDAQTAILTESYGLSLDAIHSELKQWQTICGYMDLLWYAIRGLDCPNRERKLASLHATIR